MRVNLQPAWLLHSRPYRDQSLLLELFTAEYGRLSLVGKSTQRRSRGGNSAALLQPFRPLLVSFGGRAELKQLAAVEAAGSSCALAAERLFSGLYLNELLVRLLQRQDPQPTLFACYGATLADLAAVTEVASSLRRFEFTLLEALGYHFDLALDGHSGTPVVASGWYRYQPDTGLVACRPDPGAPAGLFAGSDLLAIAAGHYDGPQASACKRLLRRALASHLGARPLHSRELFRQFRGSGVT